MAIALRYSIMGATAQEIKNAGGTDIKETRSTGIYLNGYTIWLIVQ